MSYYNSYFIVKLDLFLIFWKPSNVLLLQFYHTVSLYLLVTLKPKQFNILLVLFTTQVTHLKSIYLRIQSIIYTQNFLHVNYLTRCVHTMTIQIYITYASSGQVNGQSPATQFVNQPSSSTVQYNCIILKKAQLSNKKHDLKEEHGGLSTHLRVSIMCIVQ